MKLEIDRKELLKLSKEEIIDFFLARFDELYLHIEKLEKKINKPKKTSRNSSKPSSMEWKSNDPDYRPKGGAKKGHKPQNRTIDPNPDKKIFVPIIKCPNCGQNHNYKSETTQSHQILELVSLQFEVIEYLRQQSTCNFGQRSVLAPNPPGITDKSPFGPRLMCFILILYYVNHLSIQKIKVLIETFSEHKISKGAVSNVMKRCGKLFRKDRDEIMDHLQNGDQVGIDETGWRVCKDNWWLWTFQNEEYVLYLIEKSRGSNVVMKVLGEYFSGTVISDFLRTYWDKIDSRWKQKCLSHLLRSLIYLFETTGKDPNSLAGRLITLFREAIHLKNSVEFESDDFLISRGYIGATLDEYISEKVATIEEEKMQVRLKRFRDELLVFLYKEEVTPTNNRSEQTLRSEVIHRKICHGSKSVAGTEYYSSNASVIATEVRQGNNPFKGILNRIKLKNIEVVPRLNFWFFDTS